MFEVHTFHITAKFPSKHCVNCTFQGSLESIERRMSNVQVLNTNSRLTWCIENINQKIEDARSGVTPMLCSPPFFSSDAGGLGWGWGWGVEDKCISNTVIKVNRI